MDIPCVCLFVNSTEVREEIRAEAMGRAALRSEDEQGGVDVAEDVHREASSYFDLASVCLLSICAFSAGRRALRSQLSGPMASSNSKSITNLLVVVLGRLRTHCDPDLVSTHKPSKNSPLRVGGETSGSTRCRARTGRVGKNQIP